MEQDSRLHDQDAHHLGGQQGFRLFLSSQQGSGPGLGKDDSLANVFDQEGEEDAGHEDGGCGSFVAQFADALVAEHEGGVGEELRKKKVRFCSRCCRESWLGEGGSHEQRLLR